MNADAQIRLKSRRRGAAVLEMAFVLPIFLLLVFGLVEFARMVIVKQALTDATRAGCRMAVLATTTDSADVEAVVRAHLQTTVAIAGNQEICQFSISPASLSGMESGTEVNITADVSFSDVSWIRLGFLDSIGLQGESTMTRE